MESIKKSLIDIYRNEGFIRLLQRSLAYIYDQIFIKQYERYLATRLPREEAIYNGVTTNAARRFDAYIPGRTKDRPQYESGLVSGINHEVSKGDDVVIIGGGWGVTATIAAQIVGEEGSVNVFEGSCQEVEKIRETLRLNGVDDIVDINHCIVGEAISLRGDTQGAEQISPADIPKCDVLELDCEGSEIKILRNIGIKPRSILVETHGMHNAPPDKVRNILEDNSYSVVEKELADCGIHRYCSLNDIYVLTARRR